MLSWKIEDTLRVVLHASVCALLPGVLGVLFWWRPVLRAAEVCTREVRPLGSAPTQNAPLFARGGLFADGV